MEISYILLPIGTLFALFFIIFHSLKNYGKKETFFFFLFSFIYGIFRHFYVWFITVYYHQSVFPYQFIKTPFQIFGISLQELFGWSLMAYLGWHLGSRFFGYNSPFIQFFGTFLTVSSFSMAIENVAIEAKWWYWRVTIYENIFGKVPIIGLIDWGFVGLEFAAPFFLWRKTKRIKYFIFMILFTLLHFPIHIFINIPLKFIPFQINEMFHYLIIFVFLLTSLFCKSEKCVETEKYKYAIFFATTIILSVLFIVHFLALKQFVFPAFILPILMISLEYIRENIFFYSFLLLPLSFFEIVLIPLIIISFLKLLISYATKIIKIIFISILIFSSVFYSIKIREKYLISYEKLKKANIEYNKGNWKEAEIYLKECIYNFKYHADAYLYLGNSLRKQGKLDEAIKFYKESLSKLEFNYPASKWLITSLLVSRKAQEAKEILEILQKIYPNEPVLLYLHGNTEAQLGNIQEAIKYWNLFLSLENNEKDPLMVAQTYLNLNREKDAIDYSIKNLKKNPKDWELAIWLENLYLKRNDKESIFNLYYELANRYPFRFYILKVGKYGLETNNYSEAERAFKSILNHEPENQEALKGIEIIEKNKRK